jgi:hypothetical protein
MEVTPVLPKAGQELLYFMEYLKFFAAHQDFYLFIP